MNLKLKYPYIIRIQIEYKNFSKKKFFFLILIKYYFYIEKKNYDEIYKNFLLMNKIGQNRRNLRISGGSLIFETNKKYF